MLQFLLLFSVCCPCHHVITGWQLSRPGIHHNLESLPPSPGSSHHPHLMSGSSYPPKIPLLVSIIVASLKLNMLKILISLCFNYDLTTQNEPFSKLTSLYNLHTGIYRIQDNEVYKRLNQTFFIVDTLWTSFSMKHPLLAYTLLKLSLIMFHERW